MEEKKQRSDGLQQREIIEEFLKCRDSKGAVGIWSPCLGKGMFICFVKELVLDEDEDDVVVILQENDLSGQVFETHVLYLNEIEKIYRFRLNPNETLTVKPLDKKGQPDAY